MLLRRPARFVHVWLSVFHASAKRLVASVHPPMVTLNEWADSINNIAGNWHYKCCWYFGWTVKHWPHILGVGLPKQRLIVDCSDSFPSPSCTFMHRARRLQLLERLRSCWKTRKRSGSCTLTTLDLFEPHWAPMGSKVFVATALPASYHNWGFRLSC